MSKAFADKFKTAWTPEDVRKHTKCPGAPRDKNGKIVYFTEQAHKNKCDINTIIPKYARTGLIEHVTGFEAIYADLTGDDFKEMLDKVMGIQQRFQQFPVEIRTKFDNNPEKFMRFYDDPENREEGYKMGLITSEWAKQGPPTKEPPAKEPPEDGGQ